MHTQACRSGQASGTGHTQQQPKPDVCMQIDLVPFTSIMNHVLISLRVEYEEMDIYVTTAV